MKTYEKKLKDERRGKINVGLKDLRRKYGHILKEKEQEMVNE